MTDKQIIFKCDVDCIRKNTEECFELDCIKGQESILKQLKAKEQECEELKEKCKKYGEINEQETKDYAELKAENDELKQNLTVIFACLINANRADKIIDTLWVEGWTTLWDYIAQILGIQGDQLEIEEQILQKYYENAISECEE